MRYVCQRWPGTSSSIFIFPLVAGKIFVVGSGPTSASLRDHSAHLRLWRSSVSETFTVRVYILSEVLTGDRGPIRPSTALTVKASLIGQRQAYRAEGAGLERGRACGALRPSQIPRGCALGPADRSRCKILKKGKRTLFVPQAHAP